MRPHSEQYFSENHDQYLTFSVPALEDNSKVYDLTYRILEMKIGVAALDFLY